MNKMKYLQAMISGDGNMDRKVELRIGRAAGVGHLEAAQCRYGGN